MTFGPWLFFVAALAIFGWGIWFMFIRVGP